MGFANDLNIVGNIRDEWWCTVRVDSSQGSWGKSRKNRTSDKRRKLNHETTIGN